MPILKREPEVFPPDLFGGQGEIEAAQAREAAEGQPPLEGGAAPPSGPRASDSGIIVRAGHALVDGILAPAGAALREGRASGYTNGHPANGQTNGYTNGYTNGHTNGHTNGRPANGHANGHTNGHANGCDLLWWVAHVRSRQEKKLSRHLLDQKVPYYLPMRERREQRSERPRRSFLPLFPGYLFFRGTVEKRLAALQSNMVVNVLTVEDQSLLESELRALWELQCSGSRLVPHPYIDIGDSVEIIDGALKGYRGIVLRKKGNYRLVVSITLLRKSVAAELDRETLAPYRHAIRTLPRWPSTSRYQQPARASG